MKKTGVDEQVDSMKDSSVSSSLHTLFDLCPTDLSRKMLELFVSSTQLLEQPDRDIEIQRQVQIMKNFRILSEKTLDILSTEEGRNHFVRNFKGNEE